MDRLISEQAVLDTVFECVDAYDSGEVNESLNIYIQSHIKAIPSAKPKTGYWIEGKYRDDDIRYNDNSYKCDKCGRIVDFKENYCPNCGARMESEENEDEC